MESLCLKKEVKFLNIKRAFAIATICTSLLSTAQPDANVSASVRNKLSTNQTEKFSYYHQAIPLKEEYVESLYKSVARVRNETKFKDRNGLEKIVKQEGCGIVLKGGYVLTAHHVVHDDVLTEPIFGFKDEKAVKLAEENYIAVGNKKYTLEYVVEENDDYCFSLMKIKEKQEEIFQYPFKIGDSQKVKVNDLAIIVGNSANFGIFWRIANIGRVVPEHDYFNPTENIYPGDSGGGVFTVKDGAPELVGLILEIKGAAKYPVGIGFPIGINSIMKYIGKEKPELVKLWK